MKFLRVSSPLKLRKTSYSLSSGGWLEEEDENEDEEKGSKKVFVDEI